MSEPSLRTQRLYVRRYLNFPLIWKMAIALVAGSAVGLLVGPPIEVIEPFGELFLRLLRMAIVPLVLCTLIVGVSSISISSLGRIGMKTGIFYLIASSLAISLGVVIALAVSPGTGLRVPAGQEVPESAPPVSEVLLEIVPNNALEAMAEGNMLAVVFFAIVFGMALSALHSQPDERLQSLASDVRRVIEGSAQIILILIRGTMEYAPFGVFALIAVTLGRTGLDALAPLARLTGVVYGGVALQIIVYAIALKLFRAPVRTFFRHARETMVTGFVTRSSNATLPVGIRSAQRMGVQEGVYGFSLPFGVSVNMDGTALYVGASVIFVANVSGVELSVGQLLGVIVVGVLASIGTAGVPGAGLIMLSLAITQAGLPFAAVALVAGIDVLLDMARTTCNVTGVLAGTRVVAGTEEGMLKDPEATESPRAREAEDSTGVAARYRKARQAARSLVPAAVGGQSQTTN